jgi:hypothetical protein
MSTEMISYIVGGSFGIFLTIQYSIFFLFLSKKKEIKKSRQDLLYIILLGICLVLMSLFSILSHQYGLTDLGIAFYKLRLIIGITTLIAFVLLIRYLLISIKDMTFVETDDYKNATKTHLILFLALSAVLIICIAAANLKYYESKAGFSYIGLGIFVYILISGLIETLEFQKIIRREIGKINTINFLKNMTILSSGIIAIVSAMTEIVMVMFKHENILLISGSLTTYGMAISAVILSLNLVFEYMDVLSRSFEANKKLSELNRQMMEDVRTAQSLQISLLPLDKQKIIQKYIDMEISYMPMQSVGGDYYDFYLLDERKVLLFLGDASGHGVYAAMIWAMLKVEVEELIEDKKFNDLAQAFTLLNQRITRILENTYSYATLFACMIDLDKSMVSYVSAGHTDQLFYSKIGNAVNKIRNKNPIIGTFKNARFSADSITYVPGDTLLLFSDGIIEEIGRAHV